MLGLTFSSLAWLNMLAGFVESNTFHKLAGYPSKVENMLIKLNVRAESQEIRQFPYFYHDNGHRKTTEVRYPESLVNLGVAWPRGLTLVLCRNSLTEVKNGVVKRKHYGIN